MTRAAIYTRFSSHMQREASIEDQERLCRERAEREGWEVAALFADRALSGASMLRPGLQGAARLDAGEQPLAWVLGHRVLAWLRLQWWSWMG